MKLHEVPPVYWRAVRAQKMSEVFEGLIASVELINFMCHSHLVLNLNKQITVVAGRNGSGKSAIMIAIGLALGQRAQHLERGNSLKELIKSKEGVAVVRVALNNSKGFKRAFFGDTIVVEKRISAKSSTTSVMNGERRVWSMKRDDLEMVLDFFSLRLDNPLNFLTQEQAKRFLNVSQPETLYELFMRGTEIADVCQLNEESMRSAEAMTEKIEGIGRELESLGRRVSEEDSRLSAINNIKTLESELAEMENEMLWARLETRRRGMDEAFGRFKDKQNELDGHNESLSKVLDTASQLREEILKAENEEAERKRTGERRREEIESEVSQLEIRHREISSDVKELGETKSFKDKIIVDFERQSGPTNNLHPQLEERCRQIEADTREKTELLAQLSLDSDKLEEVQNSEREVAAEHENKMFQLKKHIEFYSKNDQNAFFSPNLPKVMAEISRFRFRERVVGPMAFRIKLREQKWSKTASIVLNNHLTTFIALNKADKSSLIEIFKRFSVDFPISMPSSNASRVVEYKRNASYRMLLDVLDIDEPLVVNHLIMAASVEQIILVEDRKEAYGIVRMHPAHVECAYTRNGDRIKMLGGSLSDFVARGVDRFYFENTQQRLEACRLELKKLQEKRIERGAEGRLREIRSEMEKISESVESNRRAEKTLRQEIENARQIYEAQLKIVHSEGLYEEVKSLGRQIELLERKQVDMMSRVEALKRERDEIRSAEARDIGRMRSAMTMHAQEERRIRREIDVCHLDVLRVKGEHQKQVDVYSSEKAAIVDGRRENLEPRSEAEIRNRIVEIRAQIEMSSVSENEKDTVKMLRHLEDARRKKERLAEEYREKVARTLEDVRLRIAKRDRVRNEIAGRAGEEFSTITRSRGYEGELGFDHDAHALSLRMKVHGHDESGSKSTLSGGERSFAGVSLLLSLWPSLCCPVKILDEFDVFMDSLNRKHIIRLLLEFFRRNSFQAILITPLNTEDLFEDFCDVVVLDKPERLKTD